MTPTFWLEQSTVVLYGLRRYSQRQLADGWDCAAGYHQALVWIGRGTAERSEDGYLRAGPEVSHDDPNWPTKCVSCDYLFKPEDHWQEWTEQVWIRTDTGEERILRDLPNSPVPTAEPGASWNADWMPSNWRGADGIALMVRLPDMHDWHVDSRASNCTMPDDNVHKCWVRHGDPRECAVTVDKNGVTCQAGAGSIDSGTWHGFLQAGQLVP